MYRATFRIQLRENPRAEQPKPKKKITRRTENLYDGKIFLQAVSKNFFD